MLAFMSPAMNNPRFEAGKIVVDSQRFHKNSMGEVGATDVIYERLYVLRPDMMRVIAQLNEANGMAAARDAERSSESPVASWAYSDGGNHR
jgi:hypothetical protein